MNKSTYFSKARKHNYVGDSSQHTLVYCNGWTSRHTLINVFFKIKKTQICWWFKSAYFSILQRVKQVNILFKIKKTQLCWWFKSTYLWIQQFRNTHGWNKSTYFSKWRKHIYVGDSSQHTLAYCNGWNKSTYFCQLTFQNQENSTVLVIQVSIL